MLQKAEIVRHSVDQCKVLIACDNPNAVENYLEDNNDTSHIKLIIVSKRFDRLSKIDRERLVHKLLSKEISKNIHSIRLKLYTLEEYQSIK